MVDDRHRPAADQLLHLDQAEIRLDAGGVAVEQQADGAGRGQDGRLRVAHAPPLGVVDRLVPRLLGGIEQCRLHKLLVDLGHLVTVHPQDPQHVLAVVREAGERAHPDSGAGRGGVGMAGHEGGDRAGPRPPLVRVVGHAHRHQQGAKVGVAEAELAEPAGRVGDLLGRVVGVADQDLLGGEHDLDGR